MRSFVTLCHRFGRQEERNSKRVDLFRKDWRNKQQLKKATENQETLLKIKEFKMPDCKCKKCGKIWHGWSQSTIYPYCGSEIEKIENDKKKQR